ncbi:hypothetical protein J6590_055482 [Homalodisca vitripennis]|nr:hypothetical protein J6590_055482 [Homalodisca vitripennis]
MTNPLQDTSNESACTTADVTLHRADATLMLTMKESEVLMTGTGGGGRGRRLRAANQLRVNRTALPFSYPHVTPQSQSLPSNRFVRFTL